MIIVVVLCRDLLSAEEAHRLRAQITQEVPGYPIIILPPGASGIELRSFPSEDAMSKTDVSYACPSCGKSVDQAEVVRGGYEPTANDLALRPEMKDKGREYLACPCGRSYTWFSALEVTTLVRT